jgi:hypothetical protein
VGFVAPFFGEVSKAVAVLVGVFQPGPGVDTVYRARLSTVWPWGFHCFVAALLLLGWVALNPQRCFAADDEAAVKKAFEVFQGEWLNNLNRHGDYGLEKLKVEKEAQGRYTAVYRVLTESVESEVKATGDKRSPYVGVLKYEEQTYASHADTPELAKEGPFQCERTVVVTEIFPYSRGKWLYE